jgi:hypothetical protein
MEARGRNKTKLKECNAVSVAAIACKSCTGVMHACARVLQENALHYLNGQVLARFTTFTSELRDSQRLPQSSQNFSMPLLSDLRVHFSARGNLSPSSQ